QALAQDHSQVHLDSGPAHESNQDQTPADFEALQVALPICRPNKILYQLDTSPVGELTYTDGKILGVVIDAHLNTQRCNTRDLVWRAGRGKDSRPDMPRHLNPSSAHAAGASVDQDGLAGCQLPQGEERLIGRKEHFWNRCGL